MAVTFQASNDVFNEYIRVNGHGPVVTLAEIKQLAELPAPRVLNTSVAGDVDTFKLQPGVGLTDIRLKAVMSMASVTVGVT